MLEAARLRAAADLLRRYRDEFRRVWGLRNLLAVSSRARHELEFLPATIALVETPVHPAPRVAMRLIVALVAAAAAFALFGRLDIVATTRGKLLPSDRVKLIQPAFTGVMISIDVRNGQRVRAGDPLLELDPTQSRADREKAAQTRVAATLAVTRGRALLSALASASAFSPGHVDNATTAQQLDSDTLGSAQLAEYRDRLSAAQAEFSQRQAELQSALKLVDKQAALAPLARQQADEFQALVDKRYVARADYLQREQAALEQEHDLQLARSHERELESAVAAQRAAVAQLQSEFRRQVLDTIEQASEQIAQTERDEAKARAREALAILRAPVDGTVQQLVANTPGGVVTTAQTVMEIVPDDALEVEVAIPNKDIGFVRAGQRAVVKLDAFPYTQYGTLEGVVRQVSNDSVEDRKSGLSFVARISLAGSRILADGHLTALTPGMAATADIRTGTRSVGRYFLEPLMQASQESLRER